MNHSFSCSCGERLREPKKRSWVVIERNFSFDGYHKVPSQYSLVECLKCKAIGRTKAKYVDLLPDQVLKKRSTKNVSKKKRINQNKKPIKAKKPRQSKKSVKTKRNLSKQKEKKAENAEKHEDGYKPFRGPGSAADISTNHQFGISKESMRLLRSAIKNNYDIPKEELTETPKILMKILKGELGASVRSRLMAARTLKDIRRFTLEQMETAVRLSEVGIDEEEIRLVKSPLKAPERNKP